MAKFSPESGRHKPELFNFSEEAEAEIQAKIALLQKPQISDEELASVKETQHLSVDELIARVIANSKKG